MDVTVSVKGLDDLDKALSALPGELARHALGNALMSGGEVIAEEMRAEVPRAASHDGFHLQDEIRVQQEKKPIDSAAEVYVGPSQRVAYRARWQEFGTTTHAIAIKRKKVLASTDSIFGRKVTHPGQSPRPFMRTALQAKGSQAIDAIAQTLREEIPKAAKKVSSGNH